MPRKAKIVFILRLGIENLDQNNHVVLGTVAQNSIFLVGRMVGLTTPFSPIRRTGETSLSVSSAFWTPIHAWATTSLPCTTVHYHVIHLILKHRNRIIFIYFDFIYIYILISKNPSTNTMFVSCSLRSGKPVSVRYWLRLQLGKSLG